MMTAHAKPFISGQGRKLRPTRLRDEYQHIEKLAELVSQAVMNGTLRELFD
ncbi:hypothetical protein Rhow_000796 [Rhodococcus wratislaviensis]|uniref:Uncharacterized protein n=1 Tax=Rhodococcus wratislaviensis TaxID=44752 RepID=A0A402C2X2_RHOWR|nr:hypothetical protein Rhow_000796 [Rhodococcus wratislaviensis]